MIAITLFLLLQTRQPITCQVFGVQPAKVFVTCRDKNGFPVEPDSFVKREDWPSEWYPPRIMQRYNAELIDGAIVPVFTPEPVDLRNRELRRWRLQPIQ